MLDFRPLVEPEDGGLLRGRLVVSVRTRTNARPVMGQRVRVEGDGCWPSEQVLVTGRDGRAEAHVPVGRATVVVDSQVEEVWIGPDHACLVELYC